MCQGRLMGKGGPSQSKSFLEIFKTKAGSKAPSSLEGVWKYNPDYNPCDFKDILGAHKVPVHTVLKYFPGLREL